MKPTEKHTEVRAFRVDYMCRECGADMTFGGTTLMIYPPRYRHICCKCGTIDDFQQITGHIIYKETP